MANKPPPVKCTRCGEPYSSYGHQCKTVKEEAPSQLDAASCSEIERLRASMTAVAQMLRESADAWMKMKEAVRYDDPPRIRAALDVHCLHLGDLALELEMPGRTKYSPSETSPSTGANEVNP